MNRAKWCPSMYKGTKMCETNRTVPAEQGRQARKVRANNPPVAFMIPCLQCPCTFRAQSASLAICASIDGNPHPNISWIVRVVVATINEQHTH